MGRSQSDQRYAGRSGHHMLAGYRTSWKGKHYNTNCKLLKVGVTSWLDIGNAKLSHVED